MNLILKGRGVDLNDRLRDYASVKLTKSQRFFERIIKMEVEFSEERNPRVKNRHKVEVTVKTPRETLRAHGAGTDYFAAIDQVEGRLERQVKKFKGRLSTRRGATDNNHEPPGLIPTDRGEPDGIVRTVQPAMKPMTPDEAAMELEVRGLQFLLFTNAENMSQGVIYRRSDGRFGLIEQER